MKVAVTGGTGFIGRALVKALLERGDEVLVISRQTGASLADPQNLHRITWSMLEAAPSGMEGVDAVVNLAGESINQRWNDAAKALILQSRLDAAERIGNAVAALANKPSVVVNASGISIYGTSESETFDERSAPNITDFLSEVVKHWEAAADIIDVPRLVKVRVGVVLGTEGGAFPKMALPFRLFAGGRVGSGKQWLSWIHIRDMTRLLLFCIDNPRMEGPVNAAAPVPVTNDQFGRALAAAMRRPYLFPVPAFVMKAIFGELSVLLLEGQRVVPGKALEAGFEFRYPTIESAIHQLTGKSSPM
ncbi:TIGR01777 family oxidoreductase [Paenibacillus humicola]|uniref:TIGR01777 family oxidoreductase n=1 Tax=Paenibacillus humicola TaxID=3110540 RepID=UPI00237BA8CD|nr:TIGR01777 family oxidoreductase [Paenibacillus humicola]